MMQNRTANEIDVNQEENIFTRMMSEREKGSDITISPLTVGTQPSMMEIH